MLKFTLLKFGSYPSLTSFFLEIQSILNAKNCENNSFILHLRQRNKAVETHKSHSQDSGGDQCDGHTFHALGHAKMTNASVKPTAMLAAYTTLSNRFMFFCTTRMATPSTAQLVVISGRKTPRA